jgi:hypothetical protein
MPDTATLPRTLPGTLTILSPVAPRPEVDTSTVGYSLDRPIAGVRVGLEIDYAWIAYIAIIDEWEKLLRADGAEPHTLWVERSRDDVVRREADQLRADIEEWSRLIDCGVVGLGN